MTVREQIWLGSSKANMMSIIDYIGDDESLFADLMDLFFNGVKIENQRAAYVLSNAAQHNQSLATPYLERLVLNLDDTDDNTVVRNTLRTFQYIDSPKKVKGRLVSHCFMFLENLNQPIAIRAFSMQVLLRNVKEIPELRNELKLLIEENMINGSSGIKARGKRILSELNAY